MKLYEIDGMLRDFLENGSVLEGNTAEGDEVMNEDGELLTAQELEELNIARDEKIEGIAVFIKELLADEDALKAEADRIAQRRKSLKNKAEWLKNYLATFMPGEKFESPKAAISWRKSEKVLVEPGTVVPDEYLKFKEPDYDKTALKQAIKSGKEFDGVSLVETQNIQIK